MINIIGGSIVAVLLMGEAPPLLSDGAVISATIVFVASEQCCLQGAEVLPSVWVYYYILVRPTVPSCEASAGAVTNVNLEIFGFT